MKKYGLIFDIDGVIADTEAINSAATIKVFKDLFNVDDVKRSDFEKGLGRGAEQYVLAAADIHGIRLTDDQVKQATQLRQDYFLKVLQSDPLPPFPGVMELIESAFQSDDFKLAIATSGTLEKSKAVLDSANIPYDRMVYVNGNDVKNKKPDPELFLLAIKKLALLPADCLVIEDAPNGIEAAKAAGTKVIAVTNSTKAENLKQADLICNSLKEIDLQKIRKLIKNSQQ